MAQEKMSVPPLPLVSVIIPSYNSRQTIRACLDSLKSQQTAHSYEVVVADSSDDGTGEFIREAYLWVRLVQLSRRTYPGPARNAAVDASQAEILAFVDADCEVAPDWIERIVAAHQAGGMVVGGAVVNGTPDSYTGTAEYLTEFSKYSPQQLPGDYRMLPTCNLSLRREIFDAAGRFEPVQTGKQLFKSEDLLLCHRIKALGYPILFNPDMKVTHYNRVSLKHYLTSQWSLGFGSAIARRIAPMVGRVMLRHVSLQVLLPLIMLLIIGWRMAKTGLRGFITFLLHTPLIFWGLIYYAMGFSHGVMMPLYTINTDEKMGV
jgi:glycosyltransferase involved in cell wall biosynthesis